jgi:lipid-A-disaccharide synthase
MIIAGEPSGDLHGASLVRELKRKLPDLEICGIGGDRMRNEGMSLNYHIKDMAFLGFAEIVKHIPFIRKVQNNLMSVLAEKKIKNVVLIDYPGFNLSFSKKAKKLGINILYYISPQIWAWGKGRIKKIKKLIDKMIVVFPFEKNLYRDAGVDADYVGHPLIDRLESYGFLSREDLCEKFSLDVDKGILLLLPGSRQQEIKRIFPSIIASAEKLAVKHDLQIVVSCPETIDDNIYGDLYPNGNYMVVTGNVYDLMRHSKFGIIKSGTSTLETGLMTLPFVIVYSTSRFTYLIGKKLIKLKNIGMVNILAGSKVIDEFIQDDLKGSRLFNRCDRILSSESEYNRIRQNLEVVKQKLGGPGASERAAQVIVDKIYES